MNAAAIGIGRLARRRCRERQVEDESHALVARFGEDLAAMLRKNPSADSEAQSAAGTVAASAIRCVLLKDRPQVFGPYPHAVIGNFHPLGVRPPRRDAPPLDQNTILRNGTLRNGRGVSLPKCLESP